MKLSLYVQPCGQPKEQIFCYAVNRLTYMTSEGMKKVQKHQKSCKKALFSLKRGKNIKKCVVFGKNGAKLAVFGKKEGFLAWNSVKSQKVAFFGNWVWRKFAKSLIRDRVIFNCYSSGQRKLAQKTKNRLPFAWAAVLSS
jgi:hypothetical protein